MDKKELKRIIAQYYDLAVKNSGEVEFRIPEIPEMKFKMDGGMGIIRDYVVFHYLDTGWITMCRDDYNRKEIIKTFTDLAWRKYFK